MPKSFCEDWLWGPHDPKARSPVGAVSWAVVQSVYWEYLFLSYILFNACVKLTYLRILVGPCSRLSRRRWAVHARAGRLRLLLRADGAPPHTLAASALCPLRAARGALAAAHGRRVLRQRHFKLGVVF